jgi:dihydrofolate reductase
MPLVRLQMTMSLDGYVAGPNQSLENPLGERAGELHEWAFAARSFRQLHGMEGGATGVDDDVIAESMRNIGATIMGRNMFGPIRGAWDDNAWKGWWGDNPPFHAPVFVLTSHAREPLEMEGGTTFHFVTEGVNAALERAKRTAGEKDVNIGGGASVAQQFLKAGLIDELEVHVAPILLGGGSRLFDNMDGWLPRYEPVRLVCSPAAAHFKYRLK